MGRDQCMVQTTAEDVIICIAPQRDEPVMESVTVSGHTPHCTHCSYHYTTFQVSFGQNINNSVGQLEYFFTTPTVDIAPIILVVLIVGGAAGGVVLLICVIFVLIIFPVMCYYHSTVSKYKEELKFAQQPVYIMLVYIIAYFK